MSFRPKKRHLLRFLPNSLVLTDGPDRDGALYLTFDDGPDPEHTPRLLDLLRAHGARASFFLIGSRAERYPWLVERIVAEGHLIGNHSYSHPLFGALPLSEQLIEIDRTDRALAAFDGRERHRFRPPRGALSVALLLHFARHQRNVAYWSYDSRDYLGKPAEELIELLRSQPPRPGDIMLLHDDSDCSARILETLLPEWHATGFTFQPLPELVNHERQPSRVA